MHHRLTEMLTARANLQKQSDTSSVARGRAAALLASGEAKSTQDQNRADQNLLIEVLQLRDLGEGDEAELLLREALGLVLEEGPDTIRSAFFREILAVELHKRGEFAEEAGQLSQAATILRTGDDKLWLASVLAKLGDTLLTQGRAAEAESILRECLELRIAEIPDDWLRYNAASMLGGALYAQGKLAEAEPLLVEAAQKIRPIEQGLFRRREALERVIALFEATQRPDEAATWRKELLAFDEGR